MGTSTTHLSLPAAVGADLAAVLDALARASARLATDVASGAAGGPTPTPTADVDLTVNASGDTQVSLDVRAHQLFLEELRQAPVFAVVSEEANDAITIDADARLAVALDPLDGSGNVAVNGPIGTIFSVLSCEPTADPADAFLGDGGRIVASGIATIGPTTMFVVAAAGSVSLHRRGPDVDGAPSWQLLDDDLRMPADATEYAINASNSRHWPPTVRRYVDDLVAGGAGPRGTDFNMRWIGALVAEVHRILFRGGIYLYPADARAGYEHGRLRLLYEGHPVAHLVETAGGAVTDGRTRLLEVEVTELHQRTPLVFGSIRKMARAAEYDLRPHAGIRSPLFAARGLFRS